MSKNVAAEITKPTAAQNTGEADPAVVETKASPAQIEMRALREKLGPMVQVLADDASSGSPTMLKRSGAALFVAHVSAEIGVAKASAMSAKEIVEYAARFRAKYPLAWGAAARSDAMSFVRFLKLAGLVEFETPEARQALIVEYQGTASKLGSV